MWAVEAPHPAVAHILLESAADVSVSSKKGFTPLLLAARNGDVELARLLIAAGADVNEPGSDGTHALPLAIISGHDAFAMFLLEQGADPRGTIDGVPAIHAAAGDVTTWLVDWYREHGGRRAVDAGGRGISGLSPERRLPLVAALLARGADPNARIDKSAVVLSYIGTTRYGVFEQNSVGTGDVRGATPLWVAAKSSNGGGLQGEQGPPSQYRYDSSADIIRTLVAAGADPNLTTDDGTTPLMMAAGLGVRSHQPLMPRGRPSPPAEAAVRALVEAGAEVNASNNGEFTALHGATFRGLNEVIQYLVEQGADIDARDYRGRTAYRMAEGAKQSFQYQAFPADRGVSRAARRQPAPGHTGNHPRARRPRGARGDRRRLRQPLSHGPPYAAAHRDRHRRHALALVASARRGDRRPGALARAPRPLLRHLPQRAAADREPDAGSRRSRTGSATMRRPSKRSCASSAPGRCRRRAVRGRRRKTSRPSSRRCRQRSIGRPPAGSRPAASRRGG